MDSVQTTSREKSGIEVISVEPEERFGAVVDALRVVNRYGREEMKTVLEAFSGLVKSRGLNMREVPLVIVNVTTHEADELVSEYRNQGEVRLELIQIGGLDASKPISDVHPKQYLVLPLVRGNGVEVGKIMEEGEFVSWCSGLRK